MSHQASQSASNFAKTDPFNYPMPNRSDLMSLSSINPNRDNMKCTTTKFQTIRSTSSNLNTSDINGAVPKLHGSRAVADNKQQWNLSNHDIDRSAPRQLHIHLVKPENNMKTNDIEFAHPQCVKFKSNRQGIDVLNPNYNLQSVTYLQPEKPRYIRDGMSIADIDGTKPTKKKHNDIQTRQVMNINDIEGTNARIRHKGRPNEDALKAQYDPNNYRDVTHSDFRTTRSVNPLMPHYVVRNEDNTTAEIGDVQGSKPCVLPPPRQDKEFVQTSLKTTDILGCAIGTKGLGNFHTRERRGFKNTNNTADIFGAQTGSLKKAPETKRFTHPLNPDYQMPGRLELNNTNDVFGKKNAVQQAMLEKHMAKEMPPPVSVFQKNAAASLGINEVSKLSQASRECAKEVQKLPDNPSQKPASRAPSERVSEAAASQKSGAQKLDSFIGK